MNAVGPVAVIAAGIFIGYLVLSGRAQGVLATLSGSNSSSDANTSSTPGQADTSNMSAGSYANTLTGQLQASQNNLKNALISGGGW